MIHWQKIGDLKIKNIYNCTVPSYMRACRLADCRCISKKSCLDFCCLLAGVEEVGRGCKGFMSGLDSTLDFYLHQLFQSLTTSCKKKIKKCCFYLRILSSAYFQFLFPVVGPELSRLIGQPARYRRSETKISF